MVEPVFPVFGALKVGERAALKRRFTAEAVAAFANLSGDSNPLHVDEAFANRTRFKRRVAHGMLSAAYVSSLIGTQLPGAGALWFQQEFNFPSPIFIGDEVEFVVRIEHISEATRTLMISVQATNQHGNVVMKGQGRVMMLEESTGPSGQETSVARVALVTGASRGIGAAIAAALGRAGVSVAVNYLRSEEKAREVVRSIKRAGGNAMAVEADVADIAAVRRMVESTSAALGGPIEILVNNASGPTTQTPVLDAEWADLESHLSVQVRGAFNCIKVVAPGMVERTHGYIVNIGSTSSWGVPPSNWSGYVMAKAALAALTRSVAVELGPKGIRVNMVSPGMTETDLIADVPDRMRKVIAMQTPLRRLATPGDVAEVVAMLCGPAGAFIHGAELPVCGGGVM
jgi:3-oxoacyl-[acyl-carrier protein] reductase